MPRKTPRTPLTSLHGATPLCLPFEGEDKLDAGPIAYAAVAHFNAAVEAQDWKMLRSLFHEDSWFKDHVSLTADVRTLRPAEEVIKALSELIPLRKAHSFALDVQGQVGMPMFQRMHPGLAFIDAPFTYMIEAPQKATCGGFLKLVRVAETGEWKIWVMFSALLSLEQPWTHPAQVPAMQGVEAGIPEAHGLPKDGLELDALCVGAGTTGLATLTSLRSLGVKAIAVDRFPVVGHLWDTRYAALSLHTTKWFNRISQYMDFPADYPDFVDAQRLATYMRDMVTKDLKLPVYCGTNFVNGTYDWEKKVWTVKLKAVEGEEEVTITTKHIVMTSGVLLPDKNEPKIEGKDAFKGEVKHSSEYKSSTPYAGKNAVVIGTGASGHDIAGDLQRSGAASVTLVQRGKNFVFPVAAQELIIGAMYNAQIPLHISDLMWGAMPTGVARQFTIGALTQGTAALAPTLLEDLEKVGFRVEREKDFMHYALERHGGHYQDVDGVFELITSQKIKVKSDSPIARFSESSLEFEDGSSLPADLVVYATGYTRQGSVPEDLLRKGLIDAKSADVLEEIGHGVDVEGGNPGLFANSGHPAFWYTGFELQTARYGAKLIALQIRMSLDGEMPKPYERSWFKQNLTNGH